MVPRPARATPGRPDPDHPVRLTRFGTIGPGRLAILSEPDHVGRAAAEGDMLDSGKGGLFLIRTDGSSLRRLTDDPLGAGYPRWSPDGKHILFSQRAEATTFAPGPLWIVDVAGGKPRPLTDPTDPGISFSGDWSPDGRQIVYDYFRPGAGQPELRSVDADGTNPSTLLPGGGEAPDWGP